MGDDSILGLPLPVKAVYEEVMPKRPSLERVLILGTSPLAQKIIAEIEAQLHCRYTIVGVVDDGMAFGGPALPYPLLGPFEDLSRIIAEVCPHRIIVALAERRARLPVHHLVQCRARGIIVEEGTQAYERLTRKIAIESLTPSSLIFSPRFRPPRLTLAVARGLSLLTVVIGLLGLAPLLGLIALAIKVDSRGPVLFVQNRVGMGGKPFTLLKFRTMHPTNKPTSEWVRDNCDRITRVGKWLRMFRLDELPQFVNILRGDMNLVGPRPHPVSNFELFALVARNAPECGEQIPYYSLRSMVRPGLTGWAQVRYRYANDVEEEIEKMRYDLYYLKHMSFWFDLRILIETIKIVLLGRGADTAAPSRTEAPAEGSSQWTIRTNIEEGGVMDGTLFSLASSQGRGEGTAAKRT